MDKISKKFANTKALTATSKKYAADVVAIARYFEDSLPPKANRAIKYAEDRRAEIFVPAIAICPDSQSFSKAGNAHSYSGTQIF